MNAPVSWIGDADKLNFAVRSCCNLDDVAKICDLRHEWHGFETDSIFSDPHHW